MQSIFGLIVKIGTHSTIGKKKYQYQNPQISTEFLKKKLF